MFKKHKKKLNLADVATVGESLRLLYHHKLYPLEKAYFFNELMRPKMEDADFVSVPMVMFVGQYSTGKTTFIRYLLDQDYPDCRIGPEPTTDKFIAIMHGPTSKSIPGNAAVVDPRKPFKVFSKFGNSFLNRFNCVEIDNELCKGLTIIDTPGILSGEKQTQMRGYDFIEVLKTFGERCDLIFLLFDAHKLDISDEFRAAIDALKHHESKIRIILNKADQVDKQALMRVYGALMWSLGKIIRTPEVIRVYMGSFWQEPYRHEYYTELLELEEFDLMRCIVELPSSSILRKFNDVICRCRSAITNAYIVSDIAKSMPSVFFKEKKKAELIDSLGSIFARLQISLNVPQGDFPNIDEYKERLKHLDFSQFPALKQKLIDDVQNMMSIDFPQLMEKVPKEIAADPERSVLRGGIFATLNKPKEDKSAFNPFAQDASAKVLLGGEFDDWIVESSRHKYDEIFDAFEKVDGKIRGDIVRPHLQKSKLPNTILMKIWKLSDIDEDGFLDKDEFALCNYLIDIKLNGTDIPPVLPKQLVPPSKRGQPIRSLSSGESFRQQG